MPNQPDYLALIPYKVVGVLELIIQNKGFAFEDALKYLYFSELYNGSSPLKN